MRITPFRDGDTFATFDNLRRTIVEEIRGLDNDYCLKASPTELEQHYIAKATLIAPTLDAEHYYIDQQKGTQMDVSRDFRRGAFGRERLVVKGSLEEEAIRTHFLIQLNGHYEGTATGETFNAAGKTDILIRIENRNIFIAECKFWRGSKSLGEAIDQLLSYLTWRDSKCALLIFNQTKDSSAVRKKMHEVMEARSEHRKTTTYDPNGDSRYVFLKADDPGREIHISTMLFDLPSSAT